MGAGPKTVALVFPLAEHTAESVYLSVLQIAGVCDFFYFS